VERWSQLNQLGLTENGTTFDVELVYAVGCRQCLREWSEFVDSTCLCNSQYYWMVWTTDFDTLLSLHLPKHNIVVTKREIDDALEAAKIGRELS
jgi:hypothetical protein